jgi:hypothetical protein
LPVTLAQLASVEFGPALRRGALDKAGAEAVGGGVVTRFGENPLEVIRRVKARIAEITPGLPAKTLAEALLKQVPSINAEAVLADRIVGKPYLEVATCPHRLHPRSPGHQKRGHVSGRVRHLRQALRLCRGGGR